MHVPVQIAKTAHRRVRMRQGATVAIKRVLIAMVTGTEFEVNIGESLVDFSEYQRRHIAPRFEGASDGSFAFGGSDLVVAGGV